MALRLAGTTFPSSFYVLDFQTGHSHRPGAEGWYRQEGEAYIRINSKGLRDREHRLAKATDVLRIGVLGDSYAEALQVPLEDAFFSVLQQDLTRCSSPDNRKTEVINFGVSDYGTAQELLTLRHRVWEYGPEIVLLAFHTGNDIRNNSRKLDENPNRPYYVLDGGELELDDSFRTWQKRKGLYYRLVPHSRLLQLLDQLRSAVRGGNSEPAEPKASTSDLLGIELGVDEMIYREPVEPAAQDAWTVTEALVLSMRDEVVSHGAAFVVVTLSNGIQVHPDPSVRQRFVDRLNIDNLFYADHRMRDLGAREGFPVLNLAPPFQRYAEEHGVYLHGFDAEEPGFGHWNREGHHLAGNLIAQLLCDAIIPR
jgi:hypothetical protein